MARKLLEGRTITGRTVLKIVLILSLGIEIGTVIGNLVNGNGLAFNWIFWLGVVPGFYLVFIDKEKGNEDES